MTNALAMLAIEISSLDNNYISKGVHNYKVLALINLEII